MTDYKELDAKIAADDIDSLDAFTRAYMECALWSSNDESTPEGGEPIGDNYDLEDIAPQAWQSMIVDCKRFQKEHAKLLKLAYSYDKTACDDDGKRLRPGTDYNSSKAGHDFWLSRNGHGAGFFDRGLGDTGEKLQSACGWKTSFPEINLYIGDDKKIHIQ
jgi:hypothetical protein